MEQNPFNYRDYKEYLRKLSDARGRGYRKSMAESAGCQTAYISHVLNGNAHLSWEQAEAISRCIGHDREETRYFLLLVEYTRAGTASLRRLLSEQLDQIRDQHLLIKERLKINESLSREDQSTYYSAWYYSAIHVALTIPALQTREALARYFGLPLSKITDVLNFLISIRLAQEKGGRYQIGLARIHLEKNSPLISKHHTNWRMRAVRALEQESPENMHYSSVFTLSAADADRIREILVKSIESAVEIVKESKEEKLQALAIDFFEV